MILTGKESGPRFWVFLKNWFWLILIVALAIVYHIEANHPYLDLKTQILKLQVDNARQDKTIDELKTQLEQSRTNFDTLAKSYNRTSEALYQHLNTTNKKE
jgi:uncharacterized coiled-coil protein SlyX